MRQDFHIPMRMNPTIVVGFGYPLKKITGRMKSRKPIAEIVSLEKYDRHFEPRKLDTHV